MVEPGFVCTRITIRTFDLDESIRFYRDVLQMPVTEEFNTGAVLGSGGLQVVVVQQDDAPRRADGMISLGFCVSDLDAAHQRLEDLHRDVDPIIEKSWGARQFVVRDPNGLTIFISAE